ncbi:MAG: THUMP domain-containing protein, partial [Bacillota bacterium]
MLMMRFSEIHLKGLNRPYFMRMLVERIKEAVKQVRGHVWLSDSRVYVSDAGDMEEALRRVRKVFGVHSVCHAVEMDKENFPAICEQAVALMRDRQGAFKVEARRSDKRYPMDSMDINREVGHYILTHLPQLTVDVHSPA